MMYTGNGDNGTSTRFGSTKQELKASIFYTALGKIDELNAYIGVIKCGVTPELTPELIQELSDRQHELFIVQAELAGAKKRVGREHVNALEKRIHEIEEALPPLTTFVLSGGTRVAAELDMARAITRRGERSLVGLSRKETVAPELLSYINRLSSYFFALSRLVNHRANIQEDSPHY